MPFPPLRLFFKPPPEKSPSSRSMCLTCNRDVPCYNGTTSDMRYHLKNRHPEAYQILQEQENVKKRSSGGKKAKSASKAAGRKKKSRVDGSDEEASWKGPRMKKPKTEVVEYSTRGGNSRASVARGLIGTETSGVGRSGRKRSLPAQARGEPIASLMLSASDEVKKETKSLICHAWNAKAFCDVIILCGVDGGVVKTSRLVLSGMSQFFCKVFLEHNFVTSEETVVLLPDVDSTLLSNFLNNVSSGLDGVAVIDASLDYLGFGKNPDLLFVSSVSEPEYFVYQGPGEAVPAFSRSTNDNEDSFVAGDDINFADEDDEEPDEDEEDDDGSEFQDELEPQEGRRAKGGGAKKSKKVSLAWVFFKRLSESKCECTICKHQLSCAKGTTTSLINHLRGCHPDAYFKAAASQDVQVAQPSRFKREPRKVVQKRSMIWNYFAPVESEEAAQCLTCEEVCKVPSGCTSNCIVHLKKRHPELFQEMQVSRNEQHLARTRKKIIRTAPKDLDESQEVSQEMSEAAVKSSPVWMVFKAEEADDNEAKAKCSLCNETVSYSHRSTDPLLHHFQVNHSSAFYRIKAQLEKPQVPEVFDPSNPLWEFFSVSNERFAQCNLCMIILGIEENSNANLSDHLGLEHPESSAVYSKRCSEWRSQRKEEFSAFAESDKKRTNPLKQIWGYFDKTDNMHEVICKACRARIQLSERSLARINQHIEHEHPELYDKFLSDTSTSLEKTPSREADVARRTCSICHKVFNRYSAMVIHQKEIHLKAHPFQCHVCGKTFARLESYQRHVHIGLKTFLCTHCGKQFTTSHGRKKHERSHLVDNPELLKTELCSFCGKGFAFKENRLRHEKIHTGEKGFQCSQCSQAFFTKTQLESHFRTHTGEKPFPCNACGLKFRFHSTLKKHKCEGKQRRQTGSTAAAADRLSDDDTTNQEEEEVQSDGWE